MNKNINDIIYDMYRSFIYKEGRKPGIIILDYENWSIFIRQNAYTGNFDHSNNKGILFNIPVISSINVDCITIY